MSGIEQHLPALQLVVPMLSAAVVMLLKPRGLAWVASVAVSLCAFMIAISLTIAVIDGQVLTYSMGNWAAPFGIELKVDSFSAIMLLVVTGASSIALIAGPQSLNKDIERERQPLFYAAWLLALAGLCGILITGDAFNVFVFMEISSLASYILIAAGPDRRALTAVFKYLVMGTLGATFYLIGVGLIYLMTGTLNMSDMALRIAEVSDQKPILLAAGFITVGLALKAAVFPLHIWLPNAYTFAPNMVTVFLAACATKVALYVLFRFNFLILLPNLEGHDFQFSSYLMPLSLLAILIASGVAIFESNLKRLLAWSSVAQIGYITLGASLLTTAGVTASVLHIFNHALAKGALFLAVACLGMSLVSVRLDTIGGIAKKMPWTMAAFVLAGFSLIGVPGTAGFISKWHLITAAFASESGGVAIVMVIVVSSLMSVVYIWRIVEAAYFVPDDSKSNDSEAVISEAPMPMLLMTWAVVIMNFYFGLQSGLPVGLASTSAQILVGQTP